MKKSTLKPSIYSKVKESKMARIHWIILTGISFRFCLFLTNFSHIFQKRVEISTPLNSWLKVQEGLFLKDKGISPYSGDTFHETPLTLFLAKFLAQYPEIFLYLIFILADIFTACCLALSVEEAKSFYLIKSQKNSEHVKESKELKINHEESYAELVIMIYMLNPFSILSCVGLTTTVIANLTTAITICAMLKGYRIVSGIFLALSSYQSLYPITLIFPMVICILNKEKPGSCRNLSIIKTMLSVIIPLMSLIFLSENITNGWEFLDRTYGFILNVRDLKPNIGLFWYFFTEMFEHFYLLFIYTFQINAFIYAIPLTIRFYNEPSILIYALCALMAIFKSYPSVGDVGFYLALLPLWKHLFQFMQQKFLVGCFFVATSVLAPTLWFLWIYSGSANANFYFGVTIAFGTAQIFLLTDVLLAYLKREFYLKNGTKKEIDGKPAILSLL